MLIGGLGAGKTRFVQGFARAMGVDEPVTSPTFALVHNYEARIPLLHADLYRMVSEHEVLDLGIDEALADGWCFLFHTYPKERRLLRATRRKHVD